MLLFYPLAGMVLFGFGAVSMLCSMPSSSRAISDSPWFWIGAFFAVLGLIMMIPIVLMGL